MKNDIIKLKDNWFIQMPYQMTRTEAFWHLIHYKHDPISMIGGLAGGLMSNLPMIMQLGGLGMKVMGGMQEGKATQTELESQAAIARYNAAVERQRGDEKVRAAEYRMRMLEKEAERTGAKQIAGYGKGGVAITGSPLGVLVDTAAEYEWDKLMTYREGQVAKQQSYALAGGEEMRGASLAAQAKAARKKSMFGAFGTALTGLAGIFPSGLSGLSGLFGGGGGGGGGLTDIGKATVLRY